MTDRTPSAKKRSRKSPSWKRQQEMLVEIRQAHVEYENLQHDYLVACGWTYTSDNPAYIWVWRKTLDNGQVVLLKQHLAVEFQERLAND